jgi:hypothetical protein
MAVGDQEIGKNYALYNGDCVEVMTKIPDEKIHLSVYSPPFGGLYCYSSSDQDLSNCKDYDQFFKHYSFVVSELFRITMPGRMTAIHCMEVPTGNSGTDGLIDFPGDIVRLHVRCKKESCTASEIERQNGKCGHGDWTLIARYSVWKEPLAVRNRTMAKNLAHKTIVDDSSRCSVASADYLLVFRRRGENPVPIAHPTGLMEYAGSREIPSELLKYRGWRGNQIENRYSHWIWRQYASAFWDDIRIGNVLPFRAAKDSEDEKHVHPLQLDVIERCMVLWSNPGETIISPFMGVGSEVYGAIVNGRKGIGIELKPSYFVQAQRNIAHCIKHGRIGNTDDQGILIEEEESVETV